MEETLNSLVKAIVFVPLLRGKTAENAAVMP